MRFLNLLRPLFGVILYVIVISSRLLVEVEGLFLLGVALSVGPFFLSRVLVSLVFVWNLDLLRLFILW